MTDKQLRRLGRRELLQLLLTQGRETEELRLLSAEREEQLEELNRNYDRLKKRLDQKDDQIRRLKSTLEEERANRRIELEEAGSIAEAALRLNGVFETAQKAAEQYLYNIRLLHDRTAGDGCGQEPEEIPDWEEDSASPEQDSGEPPEGQGIREALSGQGGEKPEECPEEEPDSAGRQEEQETVSGSGEEPSEDQASGAISESAEKETKADETPEENPENQGKDPKKGKGRRKRFFFGKKK